MIIGLIAKAGSGKDTCFEIIRDLHIQQFLKVEGKKLERTHHNEFQNIKFAGKVKEVCAILTGYPVETFYNREKYNDIISYLNISIRGLMQKVGQGLRYEVDEDIWINAVFAKLRPSTNAVFTDVRYPNEVQALLNHEAILIKIVRNHEEDTIRGEQALHSSETALDGFTDYHYEIINDGTLDNLKAKVTIIMKGLWKQTKD